MANKGIMEMLEGSSSILDVLEGKDGPSKDEVAEEIARDMDTFVKTYVSQGQHKEAVRELAKLIETSASKLAPFAGES